MITRREALQILPLLACAPLVRADLAQEWEHDPGILRIAFGSCMHQNKPQAFWKKIAALQPHRFVMLGDGVYPLRESPRHIIEDLQQAYAVAARSRELSAFRAQVPISAIWDDNDFGGSDSGKSFAHKLASRKMFLDFWVGSDAERRIRERPSGIYALWEWGSAQRRTQLIVPDLRYSRSEWVAQSIGKKLARLASGFGPYGLQGEDTTMLGEQQWLWLEECLRRPARLRILASSLPFAASARGWESWANMPHERQRLLALVKQTGAGGIIVVSGDTHYGELSRLDEGPYPLWDLTASGLTEFWPKPGLNQHRVGPAFGRTNFGLLQVNWREPDPEVLLELRTTGGDILIQKAIPLSTLQVTQT